MTGRMTAKVLVAGTVVHVDNRYLAVWVREHGAWKFVAAGVREAIENSLLARPRIILGTQAMPEIERNLL